MERVVANACAARATVERDPSDNVSTVDEDAVKKPNTAARAVVELVVADLVSDDLGLAIFELDLVTLLRWKVVNEV